MSEPSPPLAFLDRGDGVKVAYRVREGKGEDCGLFWLAGFKSDMEGNKAGYLDRYAQAHGLGAVRFDYSGHGSSEGVFEEQGPKAWLGEALKVFDQVAVGPQVLVGSSMGGWLALHLALQRPGRIKGLVLIAPAPDFTVRIWAGLSEAEREEVRTRGFLERPSLYDLEPYRLTRQLFEDGKDMQLLGGRIPVVAPVRILHGMADPDVPFEGSLLLTEHLTGEDVQVRFLKEGDHRLSGKDGLGALGQSLDELTGRVAPLPQVP